MIEILSLWRSPLDKVALSGAEALRDRQPRCSIGYDEDFNAMTIYNFGYYATNYPPPPNFDTALSQMFSDMSATNPYGATGGMAFIPQQQFAVDAISFSVPDQCNIIGSGGGGSGTSPFYHFSISGTGSVTFLNCTGNYTTGGKYFRSLAFRWTNANNSQATCIYAGTGNCRAINCTFTDCPIAFNAQGPGCT